METKEIASTATPKDSTPVPETHVPSRFTKLQEIEFSITNHVILTEISKKYALHTEDPAYPQAINCDNFFSKLNISDRIDIDHGIEFYIHVQPDMRYMVQYLMFTTAKEYPDLDIKGFPYTSLPTIGAYKLILLIGHTLLCDLHSTKPTTLASSSFLNDPILIKFLNLLKTLPVPQDVQVLIDYINPILDTYTAPKS